MTSTRRTQVPPRRRRRRAPAAPAGVHAIARLDQVRVLAHPLRLRLLEIFATQSATTKQAAAMLGESPTRLYHHVHALERVGLVVLAETRPNRGTVERYYRAVASQLMLEEPMRRRSSATGVGRPVRRPDAEGASHASLARELLEQAEREFAQVTRSAAPELAPLLARLVVRGTTAQIQRVRAELMRWLGELKRRAGPEAPGATVRSYALTLAFLPAGDPAARARRSTPRSAASRRPARASRRGRVP